MAAPSTDDWIKINDLFNRYAAGIDHGDAGAVIACFTADAVIESPLIGRFKGRAGVEEFARRNAEFKRKSGAQLRHVMSNLRVEVDGERARAFCYLLDFITREGKTELMSPGEYDCDLVKVGGEWLFQRRLVVMDRPFKLEGL
jgi:ketosteroid isomerase-like protein